MQARIFFGSLNAMTESPQATEYPVYFVDGTPSFRISYELRGIAVTLSGIAFTGENGAREVPFDEFFAIRLHTTYAQSGDTPLGVCKIDFRNGHSMEVYSGDAYGRVDGEQLSHYRAFVRELHRRIPQDQRARIAFRGGLSDSRYQVLTAAIIAGAVLFVMLPIGLFLYSPSWQSFFVMFAAGGLAYGGWKTFDRNKPEPYSPDSVPNDLLP
jgi:hypothetical protein